MSRWRPRNFEDSAWQRYTSADSLAKTLAESRQAIQAELDQVIAASQQAGFVVDANEVLSTILERESTAAGALLQLGEANSPAQIAEFMKASEPQGKAALPGVVNLLTPSASGLLDATISPIGMVRLYRQYFFEFDTFLGPPVQHLWLSPGGMVELVEVTTRRTLVERTTEQATESVQKSEDTTSGEDELNLAVRHENGDNTKLGVTLNATASSGIGFVSGSTTLGSSLNVEQSSKDAARRPTGRCESKPTRWRARFARTSSRRLRR